MNKFMRKLVIFGAIVIVILFVALYFIIQKMLNEIEYKINSGMESARLQIERTRNNDYGIKKLEYAPFKCSGIIDYKCKTNSISLYMNDQIDNNKIYESIKLTNLTIYGEDIKSSDHLSFKIETDINYPEVDKFFGDSKQDVLIAFFNKSINSILPNKLSCNQDYLYTQNENIKQNNILANTKCNFESKIFITDFETKNVLETEIDKPHILNILYDIAMIISGNSTNNQLNSQNISHKLDFAKISLTKKQTFDDFLTNQNEISKEQKIILKSNLEGYIKLMQIVGTPILKSYLGQNGAIIMQGVLDLIKDKNKQFGLEINLKDILNFKPLNFYVDMNVIDWLNYINKNYNMKIFIDQEEKQTNQSTTKLPPETDELYETIHQEDIDMPTTDDKIHKTLQQNSGGDNLDNELLEPPSLLES